MMSQPSPSSSVPQLLQRIGNGLGTLIDRFCLCATALFLAVTAVASLAVTATIQNGRYDIAYSFLPMPLVAASAVLLVMLMRTPRFTAFLDACDARRLMHILAFYIGILGLCWITMAHVWPDWDSRDVVGMAYGLFHTYDVPVDSYASRFPYQVPLALLVRVLIWVFGDGFYEAFELLNIVSVIATAYGIRSLSRALFADERQEKTAILLVFPFLPLIFYCTFLYANLITLPLCLEALALQVTFFRTADKKRGLLSLVLVCVAILLKSSMALVLIAMAVGWLVCALRNRQPFCAGLVALSVVAYLGCGALTSALGAAALGLDPSYALPKIAWVAMGLQGEVPPESTIPGWFNGYIWTWRDDAYNIEAVKRDSQQSIADSCARFAEDPGFGAAFFATKYCSEWCLPDYESLLASSWAGSSNEEVPVMSERYMSKPLRSIYYGWLNKGITLMLDCYQFVLLLGALAHVALRRPRTITDLIPLLACAGTGLMYVFWEAQAQYVMHAYVFMVPYAASGLLILSHRFSPVEKDMESHTQHVA